MKTFRGCLFPALKPQGCPRCGGSLFWDESMKEWRCLLCARPYQIKDGQVEPLKITELKFTRKEVGVTAKGMRTENY